MMTQNAPEEDGAVPPMAADEELIEKIANLLLERGEDLAHRGDALAAARDILALIAWRCSNRAPF
jgi:hypothetical protein